MLALIDCIAFSGLSPDQVDAVACYKHIPVIVAAEWAESALEDPHGVEEVEDMLASEAMVAAEHHLACAESWSLALAEFRHEHHPAA
jgi:hypothetical protein